MSRRVVQAVIAGLLVLVAAAAIYLGSCLYVVKQLADAARASDGPGVLAHTDLPRLRRSLATQILAAYEKRSGGQKTSNVLRQLLQSASPNIADQIVAQILTTQRLNDLISEGKAPIGPKGQPLEMPPLSDLNIQAALSRVRFVQPVTLGFRTSPSPEDGYTAMMHFENFEWRLAGIELPQPVLEKIAASLR